MESLIFFALITVFVIVVLVFYAIKIFNTLTGLSNDIKSAFADIDVQLNYRYALLPKLIASVEHYAQKEKEILTEISRLRAEAQNEKVVSKKSELDEQLVTQINKVNVIFEAYPEIASQENFLEFMNEVGKIEEKLVSSRRYYNGLVRTYNTFLQSFPNNIVAKFLNFNSAPYFQADEKSKIDIKYINQ